MSEGEEVEGAGVDPAIGLGGSGHWVGERGEMGFKERLWSEPWDFRDIIQAGFHARSVLHYC